MKQLKKYELDKRTKKDILKSLSTLQKSYTPEWHLDVKNPDIGSTLAILYADQMQEGIKFYNELLEVYHAELVNMMGVTLSPAQVASTSVIMNLVSDTVPGSYVPEHTKLIGAGENPCVFETMHPTYITNSKIKEIFLTGAKDGKIIPIYGNISKPELVKLENSVEEEEETEEREVGSAKKIPPFSMFDYKEEGIEDNALLMFARDSLDVEREELYLKLSGGEEIVKGLSEGEYELCYLSTQDFLPVTIVGTKDDTITFTIDGEKGKTIKNKEEYSVLLLRALSPVSKEVKLSKIGFSSEGKKRKLDAAGNGNNDFVVDNFRPFSETLALFAECYLYLDEYFSRKGAKITLDFDLEFGSRLVSYTKEQEDNELKIIKRRQKSRMNDPVTDIFVEEVTIEYYSEKGWKRIEFEKDQSKIFSVDKKGHKTLSFTCPKDWIELDNGGRCIRLQIQRADNCYMMPTLHHYPIIKNLTVEYSFLGQFINPEYVEAMCGTRRRDLTSKILEEKSFAAFSPGEYVDNALYFGFSKPFEAGPISLMFICEDENAFIGAPIRFEYSTQKGFSELSVIDKTDTFARSGQIRFMPPEDFSKTTIEGQKCYWIRIVDATGKFSKEDVYRPVIKNVYLNSVDVSNVDTHPLEDYFLDVVSANLSIELPYSNILDVDVWVNETTVLKEEEMKKLLRDDPLNTYAEYDSNGAITDFFVKWEEVKTFGLSKENDRHYILDRLSGKVIFGDGVNVSIPRYIGSSSIRIVARSCDGVLANVEKDTITDIKGNVSFIGEVTNPFPAYGGNDMETVDNALSRAAGILSNRKRLVTMQDYINEIYAFSSNIDKVSIVIGESLEGELKDGLISIILLMKDYGLETHSFDRLSAELKKHLCERTELTAGMESIEICEPIAVEITVDIWLNKMEEENDYEVHRTLISALEDYLSPVSLQNHPGWEIGKLPTRTQILMKLNSLKTGAFINRLVINGRYSDATGTHETELEDLPKNKFFVPISGKHKAHIVNEYFNQGIV